MANSVKNGNKTERTSANTDNVLLFAMSTFNRFPSISTFKYIEENETLWFKGISQLEPHTKYVITKLAREGKKLDKVVILASEKTCILNETTENWHGETANSFYRKRIEEFVRGAKESFTDDWNLKDAEPGKTENVPEAAEMPEIVIIKMEKDTWFWDAANNIRGENPDRYVDLYMDMQGGDRNAVFALNSLVNLLSDQNVLVKGRYANDFAPGKTIHTIREVTPEYHTYDLITAMEVFKKYGWGTELSNYFQNPVWGSKEQKLVRAIKCASNAVSLCDMDTFDDAIDAIAELNKEFTEHKADYVTQLDVVYQDIYRDYESMIIAKQEDRYPYVEQIRWCLRKNFKQQALTIFESKMPYEYVHSGLVYYFENREHEDELHRNQRKQEFFKECERLYKNTPNNKKFMMKDLNHYFVKTFRRDDSSVIRLKYGLQDISKVTNSIQKYKRLCEQRNAANHAEANRFQPGGFAEYMSEKYPNDNNWKPSAAHQPANEINQFLENWIKLADQVPGDIRKKVVDLR